MPSPIQNKIGAVFIPVSDMPRATTFYNRLLGIPTTKPVSHHGKIYDVPMEGETELILDGHKPVSNSSQPLFFFWTADIFAAYDFLAEEGVHILGEIQDIGSVSTLLFKDLDNNLLMVCQPNREL